MDMEDINLEQMQRNGQRHLDRGEWNKAQSLFENILEAEPENPCALWISWESFMPVQGIWMLPKHIL